MEGSQAGTSPAKRILGIDLGGTSIKSGLLDLQGNIVLKQEMPTKAEEGPEAIADRISKLVVELQLEAEVSDQDILAVGMGVPGQIDCRTGCVMRSGNLRWENVYIVDLVKKRVNFPVFMENDATTAALGEKWCGAGKQAVNFVMITIGTGIGGGIIIDGKAYRGTLGMAGEIGHMIIEPGGKQCSCGNKGCLEAYTSAAAILKMARTELQQEGASLLATNPDFTVKDLFAAAQQGDKVALKIVDKTAYSLGIGIASLVNIFNPELIVIGGGVSRAGDILFEPVRRYAAENWLVAPGAIVQIVPAQLGNDAGVIGAAAIALQALGNSV